MCGRLAQGELEKEYWRGRSERCVCRKRAQDGVGKFFLGRLIPTSCLSMCVHVHPNPTGISGTSSETRNENLMPGVSDLQSPCSCDILLDVLCSGRASATSADRPPSDELSISVPALGSGFLSFRLNNPSTLNSPSTGSVLD